jgi:hypothetical protein
MKNLVRLQFFGLVLAAVCAITPAVPRARAQERAAMAPEYLRCEYLADPEGIGETAPARPSPPTASWPRAHPRTSAATSAICGTPERWEATRPPRSSTAGSRSRP